MSLYHMIANRWVYPVIEKHIATGEERGLERGGAETESAFMAWLQRKESG